MTPFFNFDRRVKRNLLYRFPLLLYCVVIFVQSSFPSPDVLKVFAFSDKLMHFGGYTVLGALCIRVLKREKTGLARVPLILLTVLFSTIYGLSDEIHQAFVSARTCDLMDVAADAAGGFTGAVFFWRDLPFIDD